MVACASNISRGCITVSCKSMPTPRRGSAMSTSVSIPETKTFHMTPDEFRKRGYAVVDWLVHMLVLPQKFLSTEAGGGVIQDTASSASLCALLAARERATDFATNKRGCDGKLVAYTSSQAHSSIEKDVQIAGIGRDNL